MKRFDDDVPEGLWPQHRTIWIVNPLDDIPGEGLQPQRAGAIARILAARGYDVVWWTANFSHRRKASRSQPPATAEEATDESDDQRVSLRLVPVRSYAGGLSLRRLASHRDFGRQFERLATAAIADGSLDRPDLILASVPPFDAAEAAVRLTAKLDAACVLDVTELWPEALEEQLPGPRLLHWLMRPLLLGGMQARRERLIASADAVSAASERLLEACLAGPGLGGVGQAAGSGLALPTHVCRLGAIAGLADESNHRPRDEALHVVVADGLETSAQADVIIAAIRLLNQRSAAVRIHIATAGPAVKRLKAFAAELPGTATCRLTFHGRLDHQASTRLLAMCDVGLVCCEQHAEAAIPYIACDYAMAGLAIVSSIGGELPELLEQYHAGATVAGENAAALAEAIGRFAGERQLLAEARRGSLRMGETELDRERLYRAFADWLESVARQPEEAEVVEAV